MDGCEVVGGKHRSLIEPGERFDYCPLGVGEHLSESCGAMICGVQACCLGADGTYMCKPQPDPGGGQKDLRTRTSRDIPSVPASTIQQESSNIYHGVFTGGIVVFTAENTGTTVALEAAMAVVMVVCNLDAAEHFRKAYIGCLPRLISLGAEEEWNRSTS